MIKIGRKNCKVVVLETIQETNLFKYKHSDYITNTFGYPPINGDKFNTEYIGLNMYFVSDDFIEVGNYILVKNQVLLVNENNIDFLFNEGKKIVASTDTTLGVPNIIQDFQNTYCELKGKIETVSLRFINGFEDWIGDDETGEPIWIEGHYDTDLFGNIYILR